MEDGSAYSGKPGQVGNMLVLTGIMFVLAISSTAASIVQVVRLKRAE